MQEEEHDDRMLDIMAPFRPFSYNPMAKSKHQRHDKAPCPEYDFMLESMGVNVFFDKLFMDEQSGWVKKIMRMNGMKTQRGVSKSPRRTRHCRWTKSSGKMRCRVSLNLTSGSKPTTPS